VSRGNPRTIDASRHARLEKEMRYQTGGAETDNALKESVGLGFTELTVSYQQQERTAMRWVRRAASRTSRPSPA
jgi:hypothetical protein